MSPKYSTIISKVASEVLIAPSWPDDFPDNGDAADFIERHGLDAMRDHYAASTPWTPRGSETMLRSIHEVSDEPPKPLLIGRLEPDAHTILFGDGGTGKASSRRGGPRS